MKFEEIIRKRQLIACDDWKEFGEKLSGKMIPDFDETLYQSEYLTMDSKSKKDTFLGRFFEAGLAQKSMVTNRIYRSGSLLAGFSVDAKKIKGAAK